MPQWNRNDPANAKARAGTLLRRTQCGVALTTDQKHWWLVNCSPDFASQWNELLRAHPCSEIAGVVLTDAQLDHVGGLLSLRETKTPIPVFSSSEVFEQLRVSGFNRIVEACGAAKFHTVSHDAQHNFISKNVKLSLWPMPGRPPRYAAALAGDGAVSPRLGVVDALVVIDAASAERPRTLLVCAPAMADFEHVANSGVQNSAVFIFDGSFYESDEMPRLGLGWRSAQDMGHAPVTNTLPFLHDLTPRKICTHINNTNPCLDPDANPTASARIEAEGVEVAYDGMEIYVPLNEAGVDDGDDESA